MDTFIVPELEFSLESEGHRVTSGRLRGHHGRLVIDIDDRRALDPDGPVLRAVAQGLAQQGLTLRLIQSERVTATLGGASLAWWHRAFELGRAVRTSRPPRESRHHVLLR